MENIVFLKLGGSLITDKDKPHTVRPEVIRRVVHEIKNAVSRTRDIKVVIGHGSGSFGHVPGRKHQTRSGVYTSQQWDGFSEVWYEARALNQLMVDAFFEVGLPVIAFPPSAAAISRGGKIQTWNISPLISALENGIIPLINGDVVFDSEIGGTILSTEDLFANLADILKPKRILLAGVEEGVWKDYSQKTELVRKITPAIFEEIRASIGGSKSTDVTGGMLQKVVILLDIIKKTEACHAAVFSGIIPGNIESALMGQEKGTIIIKE